MVNLEVLQEMRTHLSTQAYQEPGSARRESGREEGERESEEGDGNSEQGEEEAAIYHEGTTPLRGSVGNDYVLVSSDKEPHTVKRTNTKTKTTTKKQLLKEDDEPEA
jgi:hypothetical protein